MFFLFLFTLLQLQTFETNDSFYVLLQSENEQLTFSSYRLSNPERIVLEINGSVPSGSISTAMSVKAVKVSENAGTTRFIFEIEDNTHYTVLNKSNAVIIGFSSKLFLGDGNFDTTLAKIVETQKPQKKVAALNNYEEKKKVEKTPPAGKKADESKLVGNFLEDLKAKEEQRRIATEKAADEKRLAELKREEEIKKQEELKRIEEEKRIAELKRQEELKKQEIARKKAEEKRLAELKRQEELKRIEQEKKEAEERRLAELKRQEELKRIQIEKEKAEQKRLAELKHQEELKKQEIARKKAEEKRLAELKRKEELKRIEREKKEAEERRLAELKRQEELKMLELERKKAEEKRLAELKKQEELRKQRELERKLAEEKRKAEEKRITELKRKEELRREQESEAEKKRLAALEKKEKEKKKLIKTDDGKIRNLKVTKAEGDKSLAQEKPDLPVKKLKRKGTLKNIYFRKFADFSRVTLEISGDTEYRFREIKGGYVIDVHNFKKIPRHLLNIIDARAFKAQVKYIYPKKVDNVLKIYIKTDKGIAVRKSEEDGIINFDFFEPTLK